MTKFSNGWTSGRESGNARDGGYTITGTVCKRRMNIDLIQTITGIIKTNLSTPMLLIKFQ